MATREEMSLIRAARAGESAAQLALGRHYLFGGKGLPKNPTTALYWLDRAAAQHQRDAWLLIGDHVPFEVARQLAHSARLSVWYERAYDAGLAHAGLVFARLVLQHPGLSGDSARRTKALDALEAAAKAGIVDAQWMLAQQVVVDAAKEDCDPSAKAAGSSAWLYRAARNGVVEAQRALAEQCWLAGDQHGFLQWALPLARDILRGADRQALPREDAALLTRCANALQASGQGEDEEPERLWDVAAVAGDREAQYRLGLWLARIDEAGERLSGAAGLAHYKRAIRWLNLAATQGSAAAWYALSKIYAKPECSQRSLRESLRCLEQAAQAGHADAQLDLGKVLWRTRRGDGCRDAEAASWMMAAEAQGRPEARQLLARIAPRAQTAAWAQRTLRGMSPEARSLYPFLNARLELAAIFGMTRAEALLIDPRAADCGACLAVDIRIHRPRSRRRLIRIATVEERQMLDRVKRLFEQVDCGLQGPEGNYRQRLYRLKSMMRN